MREEKTDDEKHRERHQTIPSLSSSPPRARRFSFPLRDAPRVGEIRRGRPKRRERSPIRERPLAGLAALQLATAASPALAGEEVFVDRAAQKAALLAAARSKAQAQASAQATPPAPVSNSEAQFRDATDVKEKDVRMQGVRVTEADEGYVAATYDATAVEAAPAPAPEQARPEPEPEPEPEPANVNEGGGLFGLFN